MTAIMASSLSAQQPAAPATVVILVRHAERAPGSGDVPLSDSGLSRATALAEVARQAGVDAIITTQYRRTQQTAQPVADARGVAPIVISAQSDVPAHASEVAGAVRRLAGRVILVVGHSNTIPSIVAALGGTRFPDLCDAEYDAVFTVVIDPAGAVRTIRTRYGNPSPAGAACAQMR
jgi:phosphohistidine phosphatase SixA